MCRFYLAVSFAAFLAGCPSASQPVKPAHGPERARTPPELALDAHGAELRAIPGILTVGLSEDGAGLHAAVCAASAARGFREMDVGVPLTFAVASNPPPEACGCTHEGRYYSPGDSYAVGCNTCRCLAAEQKSCTLLACDVSILTKVVFPLNSATLDKAGRALAQTIVDLLRRHATMRVQIRGHAAPNETAPEALSEARAQAVWAFLVAERIAAERLEVAALGDTIPLSSDAAKERKDPAVRRVSFDVLAP